jgi:hypothetical protein
VKSISVPIGGIVAAAVLDHHWTWGTLASVLVAFYCHRLYRASPSPVVSPLASSLDDELRPGWAGRWVVSNRSDRDYRRATSREVG